MASFEKLSTDELLAFIDANYPDHDYLLRTGKGVIGEAGKFMFHLMDPRYSPQTFIRPESELRNLHVIGWGDTRAQAIRSALKRLRAKKH